MPPTAVQPAWRIDGKLRVALRRGQYVAVISQTGVGIVQHAAKRTLRIEIEAREHQSH